MNRFARIVLGYHGCALGYADALIRGEIPVRNWRPSTNDYDWLGHGIYFWEHSAERAANWRRGKGRGVVGAVIQLGNCLDLTDLRSTRLLSMQYATIREKYRVGGLVLPKNKGGRNTLDCLVINEAVASLESLDVSAPGTGDRLIQTVRGPFFEGDPAFEGSEIRKETHIQIAVRDPSCILGVFRPNMMEGEGG